jgi:hypothetical protein
MAGPPAPDTSTPESEQRQSNGLAGIMPSGEGPDIQLHADHGPPSTQPAQKAGADTKPAHDPRVAFKPHHHHRGLAVLKMDTTAPALAAQGSRAPGAKPEPDANMTPKPAPLVAEKPALSPAQLKMQDKIQQMQAMVPQKDPRAFEQSMMALKPAEFEAFYQSMMAQKANMTGPLTDLGAQATLNTASMAAVTASQDKNQTSAVLAAGVAPKPAASVSLVSTPAPAATATPEKAPPAQAPSAPAQPPGVTRTALDSGQPQARAEIKPDAKPAETGPNLANSRITRVNLNGRSGVQITTEDPKSPRPVKDANSTIILDHTGRSQRPRRNSYLALSTSNLAPAQGTSAPKPGPGLTADNTGRAHAAINPLGKMSMSVMPA